MATKFTLSGLGPSNDARTSDYKSKVDPKESDSFNSSDVAGGDDGALPNFPPRRRVTISTGMTKSETKRSLAATAQIASTKHSKDDEFVPLLKSQVNKMAQIDRMEREKANEKQKKTILKHRSKADTFTFDTNRKGALNPYLGSLYDNRNRTYNNGNVNNRNEFINKTKTISKLSSELRSTRKSLLNRRRKQLEAVSKKSSSDSAVYDTRVYNRERTKNMKPGRRSRSASHSRSRSRPTSPFGLNQKQKSMVLKKNLKKTSMMLTKMMQVKDCSKSTQANLPLSEPVSLACSSTQTQLANPVRTISTQTLARVFFDVNSNIEIDNAKCLSLNDVTKIRSEPLDVIPKTTTSVQICDATAVNNDDTDEKEGSDDFGPKDDVNWISLLDVNDRTQRRKKQRKTKSESAMFNYYHPRIRMTSQSKSRSHSYTSSIHNGRGRERSNKKERRRDKRNKKTISTKISDVGSISSKRKRRKKKRKRSMVPLNRTTSNVSNNVDNRSPYSERPKSVPYNNKMAEDWPPKQCFKRSTGNVFPLAYSNAPNSPHGGQYQSSGGQYHLSGGHYQSPGGQYHLYGDQYHQSSGGQYHSSSGQYRNKNPLVQQDAVITFGRGGANSPPPGCQYRNKNASMRQDAVGVPDYPPLPHAVGVPDCPPLPTDPQKRRKKQSKTAKNIAKFLMRLSRDPAAIRVINGDWKDELPY